MMDLLNSKICSFELEDVFLPLARCAEVVVAVVEAAISASHKLG